MRGDTKKRILEAAIDLFKEKGVDTVTIAEICSAAGVTKKTLYYHFDSKQDIVLQHYRSYMEESPEDPTMKLALMKSYREKLKYLYFSVIDTTGSLGPDIAKSMIRTYLDENSDSTTLLSFYDRNPNTTLYLELIRLGQESGEIRRDVPPEMLHRTFVFSISGALFYWCATKGSGDQRGFLDSLFNLVFDKTYKGIGPEG